MRNIYQLYLISALLISGVTNATDIKFQIEGVSKFLKRNIHSKLSTIQKKEVILDQKFYIYVREAICEILRALGYYRPEINFKLYSLTKENKILSIHIIPGKPVRINSINITLHGDAKTDKDYHNLLNNCPKLGSVLNHRDYENFKRSLTQISLHKGYFDSHFNKSQLNVSLDYCQAFWEIDFDSGKRYNIDRVNFEGSQISNVYLQNLIPFKIGYYYQSHYLNELNSRLSATGWFDSVISTLEFNKKNNTKILTVHSIVSPAVKNAIKVGMGYSTSTGPYMKTMWRRSWVNSRGHSFIASSNISILERLFNFNYKIPLLKNPFEQYYLILGNFKCTNLNNTRLNSITFMLSRYWNFANSWQRAINLCYSSNHLTQDNTINTTILLYPEIIISRTRSRGELVSTWGDLQRYSIKYSNTIWGSNITFLSIQIQNIWIRTIYNRHRFLARSNFNWIDTEHFDKTFSDLQFLTIKDYNIRGFKYKPITLNHSELTRTIKLITGSLEYQYNIVNKWWGVLFVDSNKLISNIQSNNFKVGTGVGIRLQLPIGPIKCDLSIPIGSKEKHRLQFYIGLGPEL